MQRCGQNKIFLRQMRVVNRYTRHLRNGSLDTLWKIACWQVRGRLLQPLHVASGQCNGEDGEPPTCFFHAACASSSDFARSIRLEPAVEPRANLACSLLLVREQRRATPREMGSRKDQNGHRNG